MFHSTLFFQRVLKAVSSGMAESLHHKDEAGKAIAGQSFTATLSDLFLCGFFSTVSRRMRSNTSNGTNKLATPGVFIMADMILKSGNEIQFQNLHYIPV